MNDLEIEVKFFISDTDSVRERLSGAGAVSRGKSFETNVRYEDEEKRLIQKKSLLRLRQDRRTTLTFKSPPPADDPEFKVHRELEVEVSDFETMNAILQQLGFVREQVYEKLRETFELNETVLCLDSLPFGNFLEIEGPREKIRAVAGQLKLNWEKRILTNYLAMFETIRKQMGLNFSDITFANFDAVQIDRNEYAHLFESGDE